MSLLLEALKKAEKAKEEAQRRARGEAGAAELRIEPSETPAAEAKPVLTRAELPDIRQPLEILSDEIAPKQAEAAPQRPQAPRQAEPNPQAQAAERASAKKVFEAKFKEPNPRLPFYITMGLLGVFAFGTAGYFWYQLRPPPALVNTNPPKTGLEVAVPAPQIKPTALAPAAAAPAAIPGLPRAAPAATAPAPEVVVAAPKSTLAPTPAPAPRPAISAPSAPRPTASVVSPTRPAPEVHPKVETAYTAYLAGDLPAARADYQAALREESTNRDALLGLAAIDVRSGRHEAAEATYLRLLQADPNDAHAQAGLIALRAHRLDPVSTESRVKSLLAADPGANVLHFTLGNQFAQQGRWAEAQHEYFRAFAADPDNADFAYNLAISLDHLRQDKPALDYYRRAIALAEKRGASFDLASARHRAAQLGN